MKIILEFEEEREAQDAIDGYKYKSVIDSYLNELRSMSKYQDMENISIDLARDLIFKHLEDEGVEV